MAGNPIKFKDPTGHNAVPKSALSMKGDSKPTPLGTNPVPGGSCSTFDPTLNPLANKNGTFTPYNKRTPEFRQGKATKPNEMRMMPPKLKNAVIDIAEGIGAVSVEGFEIMTCVGAGAAGGPCNSRLLYNLRGPDYVTGQIGRPIPRTSGTASVGKNYALDRHGQLYSGWNKGINSASKGASGNLSIGWIMQINTPDRKLSEEHMAGEGYSFGGGMYGFGVAVGYSPGTRLFNLEIGIGTSGIGGSRNDSQKERQMNVGW